MLRNAKWLNLFMEGSFSHFKLIYIIEFNYAHLLSLKRQPSVWGLATNGLQYLFVQIRQGNSPTYQLMPELHLMYSEQAIQLLQVLKAICKLMYR